MKIGFASDWIFIYLRQEKFSASQPKLRPYKWFRDPLASADWLTSGFRTFHSRIIRFGVRFVDSLPLCDTWELVFFSITIALCYGSFGMSYGFLFIESTNFLVHGYFTGLIVRWTEGLTYQIKSLIQFSNSNKFQLWGLENYGIHKLQGRKHC